MLSGPLPYLRHAKRRGLRRLIRCRRIGKVFPADGFSGWAGSGRLRAAWHYLQENGCDYSLAELSKLRRVAYVFGRSTRRFDISWELYGEAGSPEKVEAIIRCLSPDSRGKK